MLRFRGITVRKLEDADIEPFYNIINDDPDRSLYIGGDFNFTRQQFIEYIFNTEYGTFALPVIIEKDEPIGVAIVNNISDFKKSAHFRTLVLRSDMRKNGYGFYAGAMLGSYLFGTLNLNKVYAGTWSHNPNMDEIYKWAGFKKEGVDRQHAFVNGKFVDRNLWGLLKGEIPSKLQKIFDRINHENYRKDIWTAA